MNENNNENNDLKSTDPGLELPFDDSEISILYNTYLKVKHEDLEILNLDDFKNVVLNVICNAKHIKDETGKGKLGFVAITPRGTSNKGADQILRIINENKQSLSSLAGLFGGGSVIDQTEDMIRKVAGVANAFNSTTGIDIMGYFNDKSGANHKTKTEDGGGPPSFGNKTKGGGYVHFTFNPRPLEIRFATDIKPNTYPDYFIVPKSDVATLHISCCRLALNTSSLLYTQYFSEKITVTLQTWFQTRVSYTVNLSKITSDKLCAYFNALFNALSNYYWHTSILSYCSVPGNRNYGMWALRDSLTADNLNNLSLLENALLNVPIPPNLNTLVFWLNQTYRSSSNSASSLLKISPVPFIQQDGTLDEGSYPETNIYNAYSALLDVNLRDTIAVIASAMPEWSNHSSAQLQHPFQAPVHDPEFLNVWANLPFVQHISGATIPVFGPARDNDGYITYSSYSDSPDGGVLALTSSCTGSGNNVFEPNLMEPVYDPTAKDSDVTTRYSFCKAIGTQVSGGFVSPNKSSFEFIKWNRGETYVVSEKGTINSQQFGSSYCNQISSLSLLNNAQQLLDWMFGTTGAGLASISQKMQSPGRGNGRRRRK